MLPRGPPCQVPVDWLLQKADGMLPEGLGRPRAFARDGAAAQLTNSLLDNSSDAIEELWKSRGYDKRYPEKIKARLGYALDQYEAAAYLVTGAIHKPLISPPEAKFIGKRIQNIIGKSGSIGKQLVKLRKRGKITASRRSRPSCNRKPLSASTRRLAPPQCPSRRRRCRLQNRRQSSRRLQPRRRRSKRRNNRSPNRRWRGLGNKKEERLASWKHADWPYRA